MGYHRLWKVQLETHQSIIFLQVHVNTAKGGGIAIITGATTYFVTSYNTAEDHQNLHDNINNQLIIHQEQDKSKEFAQWVVLAILCIIVMAFSVYYCVKCAVKASLNTRNINQQNGNDLIV